jgi:hypothetical protein
MARGRREEDHYHSYSSLKNLPLFAILAVKIGEAQRPFE